MAGATQGIFQQKTPNKDGRVPLYRLVPEQKRNNCFGLENPSDLATATRSAFRCKEGEQLSQAGF